VTFHLSRAKTDGISGSLEIAEDKAEASIACRQIGPIKLPPNLQNGESIFSEKTSLVFKTIQVVRFCDKKRNVLIYLVYSDKLIEGSPKNSILTVPILKWKQ
jgi:CreA protein